MRTKRLLHAIPAVFAAALAVRLPALAQLVGFSGPEFRVNTITTGHQQHPFVMTGPRSDFVIVWENVAGGSAATDVYAQRFDTEGRPVGAGFRANTYTTGDQLSPSAAFPDSDTPGQFVVVWSSIKNGDQDDIYAQRFDDGTPSGIEFRVNSYTTGRQYDPIAGANQVSGFEVIWRGQGRDSGGIVDTIGIWGENVITVANPFNFTQFRVNTYTTGAQIAPSKAHGNGGRHVVVWQGEGSPPDSGNNGIYGQRFDTNNVPQGGPFRVNTVTAGTQSRPAATFSLGFVPFVVVWDSDSEAGGNANEIVAQRYMWEGPPIGAPFRVNTHTTGSQYRAAAIATTTGAFVIVWQSVGEDGDSSGIFGQRFNNSGAPVGGPFQVNSFTSSAQRYPSVAFTNNASDFVVTWQSYGQDGSANGIYARIFCGQVRGDANGDNAISVSDVLYLVNYLFASGPFPARPSDVNADGQLNVSDVLYLINYLFAGGPPPACV